MPIVAPERTLEKEGDFTWSREAVGEAFRAAYHDLEDALRSGEVRQVLVMSGLPGAGKSHWARIHDAPDVLIWDACCLTAAARKAVLTAIRKAAPDIPVSLVRLETDVAVCRARNEAREGRRRVPESAIFRAWQNALRYPPSMAEGWSRILRPDSGGHIAPPAISTR